MKKKSRLLFILPAILLGLLLCYSAVKALMIYVPMEREKRAFDALKESVRAATAATAVPMAETAVPVAETVAPRGAAPATARPSEPTAPPRAAPAETVTEADQPRTPEPRPEGCHRRGFLV